MVRFGVGEEGGDRRDGRVGMRGDLPGRGGRARAGGGRRIFGFIVCRGESEI